MGASIAVLHVQVGVNFRGKGVWPSLYDVVVSWSRLLPTSILDVYKVFEHLEMLWMGIWVHTYAILHVQVGEFEGKWGMAEPV